MEHRDHEKLDRWLDGALKQYGESEPRVGLEGRILVSLQAKKNAAPQLIWRPALTLAAVLLAAIGAASWLHEHQPARTSEVVSLLPLQQSGRRITPNRSREGTIASQTQTHEKRIRFNASTSGRVARQQQFPSPQPASPEDKLLLRSIPNISRRVLQAPDEMLPTQSARLEAVSTWEPDAHQPVQRTDLDRQQISTISLDALPNVPSLVSQN
jgi:hypothetical protein